MPDTSHFLGQLICPASLQGGHDYSHFTEEETEGQREPNCHRSQSKKVAEKGPSPALPGSRSCPGRSVTRWPLRRRARLEGHSGTLGIGTHVVPF